jgi:hypothetical protein
MKGLTQEIIAANKNNTNDMIGHRYDFNNLFGPGDKYYYLNKNTSQAIAGRQKDIETKRKKEIERERYYARKEIEIDDIKKIKARERRQNIKNRKKKNYKYAKKYVVNNKIELSKEASINYKTYEGYRNDINEFANIHCLKIVLFLNGTNTTSTKNFSRVSELNLNRCQEIKDMINLDSVYYIDLGSSCISDVSGLRFIHTLHLSFCDNITDVSCLKSVHTLNISGCKNIKDVSKLTNVKTLNLSYCNIKDVSMLTKVMNLNIQKCKHIKHVGNLRQLKILTMSPHVYGIHALTNLKTLYVEETSSCRDHKSSHRIDKLKLNKETSSEIKKLKRTNNEITVKIF